MGPTRPRPRFRLKGRNRPKAVIRFSNLNAHGKTGYSRSASSYPEHLAKIQIY